MLLTQRLRSTSNPLPLWERVAAEGREVRGIVRSAPSPTRGEGKRTRGLSSSRKGPVKKPAWRCCSLRQVAVKPCPEEPESKSAFVLDAEIIPRRPAVFAPPGSFRSEER